MDKEYYSCNFDVDDNRYTFEHLQEHLERLYKDFQEKNGTLEFEINSSFWRYIVEFKFVLFSNPLQTLILVKSPKEDHKGTICEFISINPILKSRKDPKIEYQLDAWDNRGYSHLSARHTAESENIASASYRKDSFLKEVHFKNPLVLREHAYVTLCNIIDFLDDYFKGDNNVQTENIS